jgi:hypothetical protein
MNVNEVFTPLPLAASGVIAKADPTSFIGYFFCTTSGTLAIKNGVTAGDADLVAAHSVTAGQGYNYPFACLNGAYALLTGGAAGTFGVR